MIEKGASWLLSAQNDDGSWGASREGPASVEETALAVEAMAAVSALPLAGGIVGRTREAAAAIGEMAGRWLLLGPDCSINPETPEPLLHAVGTAVRGA